MIKIKHYAMALMVMICGAFIPSAFTQMIADINKDVSTDFATYHPYEAIFTPMVPAFTVASDFSNVSNYQDMAWFFNETDKSLLLQNHFTVKKSIYRQLFDVYNRCTWSGTPIFVTTDAALHTYHVLFDRLLAEIEMQHFIKALNRLTETLLDETQAQLPQTKAPLAAEALYRNLAFLSVAAKLLNGPETNIPDTVAALVDSEIVYISNYDGFHFSPILGAFSQLDYSQFKPRGHYTKNEELKAYFKSMMWYGWTIFTMEPHLFGELSSRHTLQALLLVQMLHRLQDDGRPLLDLWEHIYRPTNFMVGKTDDPNVHDYKAIAERIYGGDFITLSADSLANPSLLNAFMTEAQKLPEPKIPNWIYGTFIRYKGFRFMGQRFIPDSYMFAHLIYPYVGSGGYQRWMPMGLDITAILGSDRAFTLLDSLYQQTAYYNYAEKMAEFQGEFKNKPPEAWAQNLYWNWLYCLMPLLYEKGPGYPFFMQTTAWTHKELLTALASWAELRHDTILYAKQSMTPCGIAPDPFRSYVEPNPYLYARLASLVRYTRDGLDNFGLLIEAFRDKVELLEKLLLFLRNISIKELQNTPLTVAEYENIFCFGKAMQDLVSEFPDPHNPWNSKADDMAVVADVHTDTNTNTCLEEGVGYPLEIFVIVNEGGVIRITRGAIFSYYEFTRPIANRLTDEEWRDMLNKYQAPPMPEWVAEMMDEKAPQPEFIKDSPDYLYWKRFTEIEQEDQHTAPKSMTLFQNYPNPFNASTVIRYHLSKPKKVTMRIYNLHGQEIACPVNSVQSAGAHSCVWNGTNERGEQMSSGVYICRIEIEAFIQSRKMILVR
ncbi:DUF3160 domain-containing protein [candidate division KSB1 bacterium]|nr:DUF3160 domain-containing protein [candidate division KSB1 bacterium]